MITNFKIFEYKDNIKFHKNDIITVKNSISNYSLYLVLEDVHYSDEFIKAFQIGVINIGRYYHVYAAFIFNIRTAKTVRLLNNENKEVVNKSQIKLMLDALDKINKPVTELDKELIKYIDKIKEKTGIDLFELSKNWKMMIDIEKYNL